jgi:hypothetical protein
MIYKENECYHQGCEDCLTMNRAGYGRAGCYTHRLEKRVGILEAALEEILLPMHNGNDEDDPEIAVAVLIDRLIQIKKVARKALDK